MTFNLEDRVIDIKNKIYNNICHIFNDEKAPEEEGEPKIKWVNENIILQIKDNCP